MSISLNLARSDCVEIIRNDEIEQIARVSIEHFAIPIIAGFSMDELSQKEYEELGGRGIKPAPLSNNTKLVIYNRIKNFLKPKILTKITELVNSVFDKTLEPISDEELRIKAKALSDRVIEAEPNWSCLSSLVKDHTCLFKELNSRSCLKVNLLSFHDVLCPIMSRYRDSGELFARINLDEFLK